MKSVLISAVILISAGLIFILSGSDIDAENMAAIMFIITGTLVLAKGLFKSKSITLPANRE